MKNYLFTSESVTEGHPDKICDQISDAVLDAYLTKDPYARVACETTAAKGALMVMGEVTADCAVNIDQVARENLNRIGYGNPHFGFDSGNIAVLTALSRQSPDIAMGVDGYEIGAGDQGMVFGYACNETDAFMPLPIHLAHALTMQLSKVRKSGILPYLGPDGKSQVTVEYKNGIPVRVDAVVISSQHLPDIPQEVIREDIYYHVIKSVIPDYLLDAETKVFINPTGRFVLGGPAADTGLTGRKIIVDTYGGFARHGGGAFSGKDPTKVDRSAAYAARYVAKNLVATGLADRLELQISYAIGVAEPVSLSVDTFGTGKLPDQAILQLVHKYFDLRPAAIIDTLGLRCPVYSQTAAYGHFGRSDISLPWERLDMSEALRGELLS